MSKRLAIVDLWKFFAIITIMITHLWYLGTPFVEVEYFGFCGYIYVDFFLILTGFFTCKHFIDTQSKDIFESGIKYTVSKFLPFLPYTTVVITLQYFLIAFQKGDIKQAIVTFYDYPYEVLLLGQVYMPDPVLAPIWFLSAMLLVFPIVTFISQLKSKYLILLLSGFYPLFYYSLAENVARVSYPNRLLRTLAGLLLGVSLCALVTILKENNIFKNGKKRKLIFTVIEFFSLGIAWLMVMLNFDILIRIIVLLFSVGLGIMLSGYSFTSNWHNKFVSYLGKLSMPVFIWHWFIATCVNALCDKFEINIFVRLFMYFGGTLFVAIISYWLVEKIKNRKAVC